MPIRSFAQNSFFSAPFISPGCTPTGGIPWLLTHHRDLVGAPWLLSGWRGEGRLGRKAWPAPVLLAFVLLRWSEGLPRETAVRRGATDLAWRAAMGLPADVPIPSERTVSDFERFLCARHPDIGVHRYVLLHEHIVRLCLDRGILEKPPIWGIDSTPMWCYGAALDTVRLMGTGLRHLARLWANATRQSFTGVAESWSAPFLLTPSIKGGFDIDWKDREQRSDVIDTVAQAVVRIAGELRQRVMDVRPRFRRRLLDGCRHLLGVITTDLEPDETGRLVIARRVTEGRLVSITDRQARNGVKSKSNRFKGFKLHILGDLVSGLIAAVAVTPGNLHDQSPALRLIARAHALVDGIDELLGDAAYGFADLRDRARRQFGVTLVSPPSDAGRQARNVSLAKSAFAIDFDAGTATCPAGVVSDTRVMRKGEQGMTPAFVWPRSACDECPLRSDCLPGQSRSRTLLLHPRERTLRESREAWKSPEMRRKYQRRGEFERLVARMVQLGGRRALAWGIAFARFQAHCLAVVNNLSLLATQLAREVTVRS